MITNGNIDAKTTLPFLEYSAKSGMLKTTKNLKLAIIDKDSNGQIRAALKNKIKLKFAPNEQNKINNDKSQSRPNLCYSSKKNPSRQFSNEELSFAYLMHLSPKEKIRKKDRILYQKLLTSSQTLFSNNNSKSNLLGEEYYNNEKETILMKEKKKLKYRTCNNSKDKNKDKDQIEVHEKHHHHHHRHIISSSSPSISPQISENLLKNLCTIESSNHNEIEPTSRHYEVEFVPLADPGVQQNANKYFTLKGEKKTFKKSNTVVTPKNNVDELLVPNAYCPEEAHFICVEFLGKMKRMQKSFQ